MYAHTHTHTLEQAHEPLLGRTHAHMFMLIFFPLLGLKV
jgi:hypothetical protein